MAKHLLQGDPVSRDEICACAHVADRLIKLGQRHLAISVIEAIYCIISSQDGTEQDRCTPPRKPELTLILNGKP